MANQEEVRDVYGYFEQKGNALCYRYEAERVRIEPWGADSLRVRAWKTAEMDQAAWALVKLHFIIKKENFYWMSMSATEKICSEIPAVLLK